jgi:hypothetical protein
LKNADGVTEVLRPPGFELLQDQVFGRSKPDVAPAKQFSSAFIERMPVVAVTRKKNIQRNGTQTKTPLDGPDHRVVFGPS